MDTPFLLGTAKCICTLCTIIGFAIAVTAPNAPPPKSECSVASTRLEFILHLGPSTTSIPKVCEIRLFRMFGLPISEGDEQLIMVLTGIAEIFTTVAEHLAPSMSGFFFFEPYKPGNIRLTDASIVGALMSFCGGMMRWLCYRELGSLFTFEMSIRSNHRLITTGPYRYVRHPGYTGTLMMTIGTSLWLLTRGSWLRESGLLKTWPGALTFGVIGWSRIIILVGLMRRMGKEDEALRATFGKEWDEWAAKVTHRLIPFVY